LESALNPKANGLCSDEVPGVVLRFPGIVTPCAGRVPIGATAADEGGATEEVGPADCGGVLVVGVACWERDE
jgi:hypothetical protein